MEGGDEQELEKHASEETSREWDREMRSGRRKLTGAAAPPGSSRWRPRSAAGAPLERSVLCNNSRNEPVRAGLGICFGFQARIPWTPKQPNSGLNRILCFFYLSSPASQDQNCAALGRPSQPGASDVSIDRLPS
jgi:hypothetical protein